MTKQEFMIIVVRVAACFMLFLLMRNAPQILYSYSRDPQSLGLFPLLAGVVGFWGVLLAYALVFPSSVARLLLKVPENEPTNWAWSQSDLERFTFVVFGIWLLLWTIGDLFYWIGFFATAKISALHYKTSLWTFVTPANVGSWIIIPVQFIMSFWLLLGAKGLVRLITWARRLTDRVTAAHTGKE